MGTDAAAGTQADGGIRAKGLRTKDALAEALEAEMAKRPLSQVTVKAITQRAGVDRQTFYYHFKSMEDLVEHLCRLRMDSLRLDVDSHWNVEDMFLNVARQIDGNRQLLRTLLLARGRNVLKDYFYDDLATLMRAQATELLQGARVPEEQVALSVQYCQFASASFAVFWLEGQIDAPVETIALQMAGLFRQQMAGLKAGWAPE